MDSSPCSGKKNEPISPGHDFQITMDKDPGPQGEGASYIQSPSKGESS